MQQSIDVEIKEIKESEDFAKFRDLLGEEIAKRYLKAIGAGVMEDQEDSIILSAQRIDTGGH